MISLPPPHNAIFKLGLAIGLVWPCIWFLNWALQFLNIWHHKVYVNIARLIRVGNQFNRNKRQ